MKLKRETNNEGLKKWKKTIKERWEKHRKQVIFEGNGGIIYPTTSSPQDNTSPTHEPLGSLPTHGSAEREDPGNLLKVIGITVGSFLAFFIIVFLIIRHLRCRLNNEDKRKSNDRSLKREDTYHVYAEVEPFSKNDTANFSPNFQAVPLTRSLQMKCIDARYESGRLPGIISRQPKTNGTVLFSKRSQSVQFPPLPPIPFSPNEDCRDQTREKSQKVSTASCSMMGLQMLSTSSDNSMKTCERESVYNPLNREEEPVRYKYLKLKKAESGAHVTDKATLETSNEYFVLEKETGENRQHEDKHSHPYFILDGEDSLDKVYPSNPTEEECVDTVDCNIKSATIPSFRLEENCAIEGDHAYFVLQSTASSLCLNDGKGSKIALEDNHGQTSEKSCSQLRRNTDSIHDSFEISKNLLNLGDKASPGIVFAVNTSNFDHYADNKDSNVYSSNVDSARSDKTFSDYLEIYP